MSRHASGRCRPEIRLLLDREVKDEHVAHERLNEVLVRLMRRVVVGGIDHDRRPHVVVAITLGLERHDEALIQALVGAFTAGLDTRLDADEIASAALPPARIHEREEALDDLPTLFGGRVWRVLEEDDVTDQARVVVLGGERLRTDFYQCRLEDLKLRGSRHGLPFDLLVVYGG